MSDIAHRTQTIAACVHLVLALLSAGPSRANDYTLVPDKFVYCTTCHGVELQGNKAVDAPRLNGMPAWYLHNQLDAFRRGWRGTHPDDVNGMEMRPQATVLSEEEVEEAVALVTAIPRRRPEEPHGVEGDPARGRMLYATCAACHGDRGEGNRSLNAPPLAGQSDWYLARQLLKFKNGVRGGARGDIRGAQMRASVGALPDDAAVNDVVAYINTLR